MRKVEEFIRKYLDEANLMQIATAKGNKPWVASVWYVNDDKLNLYFISRKARRHSFELKENSNVAGAIVKPHLIGSGEKVRGIQFEGIAEECFGKELKKARDLYLAKYPAAEKIPIKLLHLVSFIATFYVIRPKAFVLFDEINFPKEPRQEFLLR